MIALQLEFIAGRFHATPWDRNVNEGEVEWPPSPWRILRAIASGWFQAGGSDFQSLSRICDALAEVPRFALPPWHAAHTRHYMPQAAPEKTGLILDAFVALPRISRAFVIWDDAALAPNDLVALAEAVKRISYLGRVESWCRVDLLETLPKLSMEMLEVRAVAEGAAATGMTARRLAPADGSRGAQLLSSLLESVGAMRKAKRAVPLGARWVEFAFPRDFGAQTIDYIDEAQQQPFRRRCERFIIEGGSDGTLRPSAIETIRVAEAFRSAAMRRFSALSDGLSPDPVLSGKNSDGSKSLANHAHAYFLPRDIDCDGRIDHVDVYFPQGCSTLAYRSVRAVRQLYWHADEAAYEITHLGEAPTRTSTTWVSETPFIVPRYSKGRAEDAMDQQLMKALMHHGYREPSRVVVDAAHVPAIQLRGGRRLRADMFRRAHLRAETRRSEDYRYPFCVASITFPMEVEGPIAIGRLAHFGLGQFRPAA